MNRIKYFTYYGCLDSKRKRNNSPAADSKTDYIIEVLNRLEYGVDIISCAPASEAHFLPAYVEFKKNNSYRYFASMGWKLLPFRLIGRYFMNIQFLFWCLFNLKRNEQVIVYHSLGYASIFLFLKRIKKIRIIGEIEEIYQDVTNQSPKVCKNEYRFIEECDKYIFPTNSLNQKLNKKCKQSVIVHGIYVVEENIQTKFADGKIHVVYGGTLDPNKGCGAAAAAAEFLPENYHLHICGFGDPSQIISEVKEVQKKSKAIITFEGELKGEKYKIFIQKCDIGLCTQNPYAKFNNTSFPSKILVYLSNGLKVVSCRIPTVEQSMVANDIIFYNRQIPEEIAEAIILANSSDIVDNTVLYKLDKEFEINLFNLLLQ